MIATGKFGTLHLFDTKLIPTVGLSSSANCPAIILSMIADFPEQSGPTITTFNIYTISLALVFVDI